MDCCTVEINSIESFDNTLKKLCIDIVTALFCQHELTERVFCIVTVEVSVPLKHFKRDYKSDIMRVSIELGVALKMHTWKPFLACEKRNCNIIQYNPNTRKKSRLWFSDAFSYTTIRFMSTQVVYNPFLFSPAKYCEHIKKANYKLAV